MLDTYKTEKTNGIGTSHKVNHKYFHERRIFCKVCLLVRTPESFKDHKMPGGIFEVETYKEMLKPSLSTLHQPQSTPTPEITGD